MKKLFKTLILSVLVIWIVACTNQKRNSGNSNEINEIKLVGKIDSAQSLLSVIYHSVDGGKTWSAFDDGIPQHATVSSFLVVDGETFASTDYDGIYAIRNNEMKWKRIDEDLPEHVDINAISFIGNSFVIGTLGHGIMISTNNGQNWSYPSVQINSPVRCLYAKGNILFAGADNGIYKSVNKGNTWEHLIKGVQVNGFTELNNKIYAAVVNGAIITNDNGANWKYIYKPHTLHDISSDGERIYAMTLGDGLKKSHDDGLTWENVNNGLGTKNLYTFELKRFNDKIFAAQWHGVYTSDDWGKSWSLIKNGLPGSTAFTTLETTQNGLIAGIGLRKK